VLVHRIGESTLPNHSHNTSPSMGVLGTLVFFLITSTCLIKPIEGILPKGTIEVLIRDEDVTTRRIYHVSIAKFSSSLPFGKASPSLKSTLAIPPQRDPLLCNEIDGLVEYTPSSIITEEDYYVGATLLVPRGGCTFQAKALAAQHLGASSILIYNNLSSRYNLNKTYENNTGPSLDPLEQISWPPNRNDYECSRGSRANSTSGWIPKASLSFDPLPYNPHKNNAHLSGDKSTCANTMPSWESCTSAKCLLTGEENRKKGLMRACCAWDIHLSMGFDSTLTSSQINIPSLFLTMKQGDDLLSAVKISPSDITVELYERSYPQVNASSFLLWFLGTSVTWLACFVSGNDYRIVKRIIGREVKNGRGMMIFGVNTETRPTAPNVNTAPAIGSNIMEGRPMVRGENSFDATMKLSAKEEVKGGAITISSSAVTPPSSPLSSPTAGSTSAVAATGRTAQVMELQNHLTVNSSNNAMAPESNDAINQRNQGQHQQSNQSNSSSLEITVYHALFFLVFASAMLFILFFFKIYALVRIFYGFGCSGAVAQILFSPFYSFLIRLAPFLSPLKNSACLNVKFCDMNNLRYIDALSFLSGYALGITWLYVGFTSTDPSSNIFYWITQNILGASICILFLSLLRLNSIKVGTVLLVAAFVYDIFFVFITPYIFRGESIMISVATSGGPPAGDLDFCEKYPNEDECQGGDPLPMLFAFPRIADYRGGSVLLGLGDVVLPGLLISFAARLDCARHLLEYCTKKATEVSKDMRRQQHNHQRQRNSNETAGLQNDENDTPEDDSDGTFLEHCKRHTFIKIRQQIYFSFSKGYFYPLIISYALGLLFAYIGVYVMKKGQPALLYLVPMNLGTMICLGKMRGELTDLWDGSNDIVKADRVVRRVPRRLEALESAVESAPAAEEDHDEVELGQYT